MIRILIDSKVCDPVGGQKIELAFDARTMADPEAGRSGTSLTLELLPTPAAEELFGAERHLYGAGKFNAALHTGEIEADGVCVFSGSVRLLETVQDGAECRYRVEFRSGGSAWAKQAALKRLDDLEIDYAAALLPTTIAASWSDDAPVKFFPVHRDRYELHTGAVGLDAPEQLLLTDDYHPFLSLRELTLTLFRMAGYTVESEFFESDFFRSLYMSGAYASRNTQVLEQKMGFLARRKAESQTKANSLGRVDANPFVTFNSVGNLVDAFSPQEVDETGATLTDAYSANGCLRMENGELCYRPLTQVNAGFEYHIRYVTAYRIRSRTRLTGIDSIWLGEDADVHFELANRFTDRRDAPQSRYQYRIVVFDHTDGDSWSLKASVNGIETEIAAFSARSALATMPEAQPVTGLRLHRNGSQTPYAGDWALYDGYIGETGLTEVQLTVRTSPEQLSPTAPKYFRQISFYGAEPDMDFTLGRECTLRPCFSSIPGYGARLSFAEVAQHPVRQLELLQALAHLFDLRFFTDERLKKIRIEPACLFYDTATPWDWSDRIIGEVSFTNADRAPEIHETQTWGYSGDDGAVSRYNTANDTEFGRWSYTAASRATKEGEKVALNPLFAATVSEAGGYLNAPSAFIMQVGDRDDATNDDAAAFTPRIVRYAGLQALPAGERWGYPLNEERYPLAAFHFAGDNRIEGFTLCFEDRDAVQGLHRFRDLQLEAGDTLQRLTVQLRISADEYAALFRLDGTSYPSLRSCFRLRIAGGTAHYTLAAIASYDPQSGIARCLFDRLTTDRP